MPQTLLSINNEYEDAEQEIVTQQYRQQQASNTSTPWQQFRFRATLLLLTIVFMISRSLDFVLLIRIVRKMHNYQIFLSNILIPILLLMVYWPITWFRMFVTRQVTEEMRQVPKWRFLVLGALDNCKSIMVILPAAYVPGMFDFWHYIILQGPVNLLLSQCGIVVNMIMSFLFLGHRFNALHVGGALIVYIGVALDIFPMFINYRMHNSDALVWVWILILFLSTIPISMSNVFKECTLKSLNMDVFYIQSWCMLFQLMFGILTLPMVALIPFPKPYKSMNIMDMPDNFFNGIKCAAGMETYANDKCEYTYLILATFLIFNLTFNYCMLNVFKYQSSTLTLVAAAAKLALSNLGFLIPFIAGEATSNRLTYFDLEALAIVIAGVLMYSYSKEKVATPKTKSKNHWLTRLRSILFCAKQQVA